VIYNRTISDINAAKEIITEKVKHFLQLTSTEIETLERGTITINTLNRIEDKQAELKELFNKVGYWNTNILNKTWTFNDIFDASDFERILNNLDVLRNAFYEYFDTPITPTADYHFENINSIERILYDLERMIVDMKSKYRQCGTFECGEVNAN
jgi:hypothetical protein